MPSKLRIAYPFIRATIPIALKASGTGGAEGDLMKLNARAIPKCLGKNVEER